MNVFNNNIEIFVLRKVGKQTYFRASYLGNKHTNRMRMIRLLCLLLLTQSRSTMAQSAEDSKEDKDQQGPTYGGGAV